MSMEMNSDYSIYTTDYQYQNAEKISAGFDPNKRHATAEEFRSDLYAYEKKLRVQYSAQIVHSGAGTIDELKQEIASLFPEYTMTSVKPRHVTEGKNLLYIDNANLQKMLKDPSYRAEIYALMRREIVGNNGYHLFGSAWITTGLVFTLSEDNPREGGVPYAGLCTGTRLDDSCTFSGQGDKINILQIERKDRKKEGESLSKTGDIHKDILKAAWEKEQAKKRELLEQVQSKTDENTKERERLKRESALKEYEKQEY